MFTRRRVLVAMLLLALSVVAVPMLIKTFELSRDVAAVAEMDANAYFHRGSEWDSKGEYDKAIADYNEALRLNPDHADAYNNRGIAWDNKGEYDKAIADYNEALRIKPKDADAYNNRGSAWDAKGEYDKAIADYNEALRLDPNNAMTLKNRGIAWNNRRDYDKAIGDYNEALRLDPRNALVYRIRGYAWSRKREYDKAIADYNETLRLDPNNALAYCNRAFAWSHTGEHDKAIADYDAALRLNPKDVYAQFSRSVLQMLIRHPDAARGFQGVINLQGWQGDRSTHAVILGHLAARQLADESTAKRFLVESSDKLADAWPYAVVSYLRGTINEGQLLELADDNDKETEARCFLGLDHSLSGRIEHARGHFRWVSQFGNKSSDEFDISMAELKRLDDAQEKKTP